MKFSQYRTFCKSLKKDKFYLIYFEDKCRWHFIAKLIQIAACFKYRKISKRDKRFKGRFLPNHVAYLCNPSATLDAFDNNIIVESRLDGFHTKRLFNTVRKYKGKILIEELNIKVDYEDILSFVGENRGKKYSVYGAIMSWFDVFKPSKKKPKGGFCSMMTCKQCKNIGIKMKIEDGNCSEITPCDMFYCKKIANKKVLKSKIIKLK